MDPLKLLTRSAKRPNKPASSTSQPKPSDGPVSNPQLFDSVSDAQRSSRKRKRGPPRTGEDGSLTTTLDFFGGSYTHHDPAVKESVPPVQDTGANGTLETAGSNELDPLSREECKQILARHKLKVTLLRAPTDAEQEAPATKKKTKASSAKSRPQLYPAPALHFKPLGQRYGLSRTMLQNIQEQGYTTTTEVQLAALPLLLGPRTDLVSMSDSSHAPSDVPATPHDPLDLDLLSVAPTGSGKTLAFVIPLIHALLHARRRRNETAPSDAPSPGPQAIILAPTKELSSQIVNEGRKLAQNTGIRVTNVRKGMRLGQSTASSSHDADAEPPVVKADILVSTPLALLNAIRDTGDKSPTLSSVRFLVLDEADVLLDPLFREQTFGVWNALTCPRLRVSFWSATMGSNIEELVQDAIQQRSSRLARTSDIVVDFAPLVRLVVGLKDSAIPNIHHQLIYAATEQGKLMALRQLLHPTSVATDKQPVLRAPFLVFTQTIERAVALHSELLYDIPPEAGGISRIAVLHSDLSETARDKVMTRFRKGEVWILITTDLLSRGVDFRGVNGVVNYDVPSSAAAYVHRVGRTGRAGREGGVALTYYTNDDIASIKTVANIIAASQKQREGGGGQAMQQWLLDALPTPSKRDKQLLKKRGVESRRSTAGKDSKKGAAKTRISTKSGFIRRAENNKRGAIAAAQQAQYATSDSDDGFGGFDE